jgi:hypothetical protein
MKPLLSIFIFLIFCSCVKKENPNPLVEKQAPRKSDSTDRAVFVSGFSTWRVATAKSSSIVQNFTPEKDSIFIEIFVNGRFETGYLAIPNAAGGYHKLLLYYKGKFVSTAFYDYMPCRPHQNQPITILSAKAGDSIYVKAIYKPYTLYTSDDAAKMLGAGVICSSLPPFYTGSKGAVVYPPSTANYTTADTVGTGRFEFKRWRETSTASETCVAISLSGIVK